MWATGPEWLAAACAVVIVGCLPTWGPAPSPPPSPAATQSPAAAAPTATAPVSLPIASPSASPSAGPGVNKRGVHLLLDDGASRWPAEVWAEHVAWAARLVGPGGHVAQLIRSDDLTGAHWQPFFDAVAAEGLVPIIRLATYKDPINPWWVPPTPDPDGIGYRVRAEEFRGFMEGIVWRSDHVVVTIGNEPNRPDEWGGAADPAAYARYLRDVAEALRRVSSVRVVILNAGLDATAPSTADPDNLSWDIERFMEGMATEVPRIFDLLDGWASHAYPLGPFAEPPWLQQFRIDDVRPEATPRPRPPSGLPNRGVNGYAWELWKLGQLGAGRALPVYVTESGWRHSRSQAQDSLDAGNATLEDELVAEYVGLAFDGSGTPELTRGWTPWNDDPRVVTAALFSLAGKPEHWGHTNLVLVDVVGRIVGAYPVADRLARVRLGTASR